MLTATGASAAESPLLLAIKPMVSRAFSHIGHGPAPDDARVRAARNSERGLKAGMGGVSPSLRPSIRGFARGCGGNFEVSIEIPAFAGMTE